MSCQFYAHPVITATGFFKAWKEIKLSLFLTECLKSPCECRGRNHSYYFFLWVTSTFLIHSEAEYNVKRGHEKKQWALRECITVEQTKTNSPGRLKIPPWNHVCSFLWEPWFVPWHIKVWLATGSDCCWKQWNRRRWGDTKAKHCFQVFWGKGLDGTYMTTSNNVVSHQQIPVKRPLIII